MSRAASAMAETICPPHIEGRHPMLYFNIQRTEKYSIAMCYHMTEFSPQIYSAISVNMRSSSEILQSERLVATLRQIFKKECPWIWPILADTSCVLQLAASPSSTITRPPIPDIRSKACKQRRRRTADLENMTLCLEMTMLTIKQYRVSQKMYY